MFRATAGGDQHLIRRYGGAAQGHIVSDVRHFGLGIGGLVLVIFSAWGGIVPFVGPVFGYSADGAGSWHWSLTHAVMALVPGAIGVVIGLLVLGAARGLVVGRGRLSLATAGLMTVACGAWFVIGPWAWPPIAGTASFFTAASPNEMLANVAGYALGPGVVISACGAFFMGWASRHQAHGAVVRDESYPATPLAA
ncbi:MAG: hypothetical protein ACRDVP_07160 [Acidimicrobiales bacterium]